MKKTRAAVFFIVILLGVALVKNFLKTKPALSSKEISLQEQLMKECAPLGQITDKEVIECEKRVRGL